MKRIVSILLLLVLVVLCSFSSVYARTDNGLITIDEARLVAFNHVMSMMKLGQGQTPWERGVRFSKEIVLYDLEDNPSAYSFEFETLDGKDCGYIIIGADKDYVPIIEYSFEGDPAFAKNSLEAKKYTSLSANENEKITHVNRYYYLKGLDYLAEYTCKDGNRVLIDVSNSSDFAIQDKNEIKKQIKKNLISSQCRKAWNVLLTTNGSKPPTSGGYITNPADYESGYTTVEALNIGDWNLSYNTTSDFSSPCVACAPTAATNIYFWWYNKDKSKYGELYDGNNWKTAYKETYNYMETKGSSTRTDKLVSGYKKYFDSKKIKYKTVALDTTVSVNDITSQSTPFHYCIYGHYIYKNHSLVGVGYYLFNYRNGYKSIYVRVADGWIRTATRFVHNGVGLNDTDMVKIVLK